MSRLTPVFACFLLATGISRAGDLIDAAFHDRTAEAEALLESGSDPNATNRYGVFPLSLACRNGNAELTGHLLEAGADPNAALNGGETALMTAARTGDPAVVRLLLENGAQVDSRGPRDQTALTWAVAEGNTEVVGILLEAGADPHRALPSGFTPLHFAARNGHRETARELLAAGVDVHTAIDARRSGKAPPRGTDALRLAVENGHFELAALLLEAGADPDNQASGHAPLHVLTWVRKPHRGDGDDGLPPPRGSGSLISLAFARLLVEKYGADIDLRLAEGSGRSGTRGSTPFLLAARRADLPYLELLHELGADPALSDFEGTSPFLFAAGVGSHAPEEEAGTEEERLEVLPWLLELGADVNEVNQKGETEMHGAAYTNVPRIAHWMAGNGADIGIWNRKNRRRWTPLLIAQGFRPGNFKPDAATIAAIESLMRAEGVEPPPAPERPIVGKPRAYSP